MKMTSPAGVPSGAGAGWGQLPNQGSGLPQGLPSMPTPGAPQGMPAAGAPPGMQGPQGLAALSKAVPPQMQGFQNYAQQFEPQLQQLMQANGVTPWSGQAHNFLPQAQPGSPAYGRFMGAMNQMTGPNRAEGGRAYFEGGSVGEHGPEFSHSKGLFHTAGPGRTDNLPVAVPPGGYVIPADVVSGLGEGNTLAGAATLDKMMTTGPFGMKLHPANDNGVGIPSAPEIRGPGEPARFAAADGGKSPGGKTSSHIIVAGGEYYVHPEDVAKLGGGNLTKGHNVLDRFVKMARQQMLQEVAKLPPPKK